MISAFFAELFLSIAGIVAFITTLGSGLFTGSLNNEPIVIGERTSPTPVIVQVEEGIGSTATTTTSPTPVITTSPEPDPKKIIPRKPVVNETKPAPTTITIPSIPEPQEIPLPTSFSSINPAVRSALVNILCTTKSGGVVNPISGSGLIIDPKGVILTNAHVAQYLLLKDFLVKDYVECVARIGSPARAYYTLDLLYISPEWIADNAETIIQSSPTGTGKQDYALLRITGRTDSSAQLQTPLPFVKPGISDPSEGTPVLVAAYPAGFLGGVSIQKDLYSVSAVSTIQKIFTFDLSDNTPDLMSLGGIAVAQKGSSGGTVVNGNGEAIGLIVTSTDAETTADRDLRATTLSHINRDLIEHAGITLTGLLGSDITAYGNTFNRTIAPGLTEQLIRVIEQ